MKSRSLYSLIQSRGRSFTDRGTTAPMKCIFITAALNFSAIEEKQNKENKQTIIIKKKEEGEEAMNKNYKFYERFLHT